MYLGDMTGVGAGLDREIRTERSLEETDTMTTSLNHADRPATHPIAGHGAAGLLDKLFHRRPRRHGGRLDFSYLSRATDHLLSDIGVDREDIDRRREEIWPRRR